FVCPIIVMTCVLGCDDGRVSYLAPPSYCFEECLHGPYSRYEPQPGDLFFATTNSQIMRIGHHLAGAADPHHSGIVVRRSNGEMALLEAGPHNTVRVEINDLIPQLNTYICEGDRVWIRRMKTPLTCQQDAQLTAFAERQEGKPFAWARVLSQLTIFRSRG